MPMPAPQSRHEPVHQTQSGRALAATWTLEPRNCQGLWCAPCLLLQYLAKLRHCGTQAVPGPWCGWSCHIESRGPHVTTQGAVGAHKTMLPRTSSSKNTSKLILMAASKQEGRERQTRLLATVGREKQLSLQAGEGLLPSQLQPRREKWQLSQMSQMSQMSQKASGPPAPNAAGCVAVGD